MRAIYVLSSITLWLTSQRPGALREFVNDILGPNDDITRFEYIKRANKGKVRFSLV